MSARIADIDSLKALAIYAVGGSTGGKWKIDPSNYFGKSIIQSEGLSGCVTRLANILFRENIHSVAVQHPSAKLEDLPGNEGGLSELLVGEADFNRYKRYAPDAAAMLRFSAYVRGQCLSAPSHRGESANLLLDELRDSLIEDLCSDGKSDADTVYPKPKRRQPAHVPRQADALFG